MSEILDPRNIRNGWEIPTETYSDQPYVVRTQDGAWLCVVTTGAGREGDPGQYVVTMRSTDRGRTWSAPVPVEPADGPEASYAVLLATPSGRVFCFYNHNTDNVREAERLGQSACFGDVTRVEVLEHLGAAQARELVIAINDADATGRATKAARRVAPNLPITVRTAYELDVERLRNAGATHVVTAENAAAGAIVAHVTANTGDERATAVARAGSTKRRAG